MIDTHNYSRVFPNHPPMAVQEGGSVYGVWYCSSWTKAALYGQYPPGFLDRALALFPNAGRVLHIPSGTLRGPGITVDRICDDVRKPMIVACAGNLPFRDNTFDLGLADPPYSRKDSKIYGCRPFPVTRALEEARRVLRPGAYLGVLHTSVPMFSRRRWELRGLVAVVTGFRRATRMFSIFRALKPGFPTAVPCYWCGAVVERPKWWRFGLGTGLGTKEEPVCSPCFGALSPKRGPKGRKRLEGMLAPFADAAVKAVDDLDKKQKRLKKAL